MLLRMYMIYAIISCYSTYTYSSFFCNLCDYQSYAVMLLTKQNSTNLLPELLKPHNCSLIARNSYFLKVFVRLFVDENLDRLVPISKQPKEKVLAIIHACHRQFPEFHDRARKRIRTYLKSCRRMKKPNEPLRRTADQIVMSIFLVLSLCVKHILHPLI